MYVQNGIVLIETVDVIGPVVDDPFTFGAISAANAISDVYAMGGTPVSALAIAGFPLCSCAPSLLTEILRGAADTLHRAGAVLLGGHSFDDAEIKFGLAVTGTGSKDRILKVSGAQPGDLLVLTKPIGIGMITTALKGGKARQEEIDEAARWMLTLNREASAQALAAGAHACTDVTGFGLLGHAHTMVRNQHVDFVINADTVPVLPAAWRCMHEGMAPEGAYKNLEFLAPRVDFSPSISDDMKLMLADPQTSGGLLMAVPESGYDSIGQSAGFHTIIGRVTSGGGRLLVQ